MKRNIIATAILLVLDVLWLSLFMGKKYQKQVKDIQGREMKGRIQFAVISYILMIIGLNLFVLPNIRENHKLIDSMKYGALFGLIVYGIYDGTAAAVFEDWDTSLAVIDVACGSFVFFIAAYIGSILTPQK